MKNSIVGLSNKSEILWASSFFLLLSIVFCSPFFAGATHFHRDYFPYFVAAEVIARTAGPASDMSQWNPYWGLGRPLVADLQFGIYYPPNLIFRNLPVPAGTAASFAFHHSVGAIGFFMLLRAFRVAIGPAILAGAIYSFGGLLSAHDMPVILQSAAWCPLAVLAAEKAYLGMRFAPIPCILTGLLLGLVLAGGFPEAFLLLNSILLLRGARAGQRPLKTFIPGWIGVNLLAFGLFAFIFLPFVLHVFNSSRMEGLAKTAVLSFSFHPLDIGRFIAADSVAGLARSGRELPLISSIYLGPAIFFLPAALVSENRREVLFWLLVSLIFLGLAFGTNTGLGEFLVSNISALRLLRYPEKYLLVVHAIACAGIALGMEQVRQGSRSVSSVIAGSVFSALLAAAAWFGGANVTFVAFAIFVCALGSSIAQRSPKAGQYLILSITILPVLYFNSRIFTRVSWESALETPSAVTAIQAAPKPERVYSNTTGRHYFADMASFERDRALLFLGISSIYGLANINAPSSVNLRNDEEWHSLLESLPRSAVSAFLARFSVSHITSMTPLPHPGLDEVETKGEVSVYEVRDALPRIYLAESAECFPIREVVLDWLRRNQNVRAVALEGEHEICSAKGDGGVLTEIVYSHDEIHFNVSSSSGAFAVINDSFYPGWFATIDGMHTDIIRVNGFVKGVMVPPGARKVALFYRQQGWHAGQMLSLICWLGSIACVLIWRRNSGVSGA